MKPSVLAISSIIVLSVVVFGLSATSSWYGDDMGFMYSCINGGKIEYISDIIPSQISHYQTGNGRFVAHVLVQLFCSFLGPVTFGVANALMYVALILLVLSFASTSLKNTKALLSVILLILICFSTKMMPSCQICYIWGFVVALAFVKVYFTRRTLSACYWVPLLLFSLFAGNFHEGVNFGIGGALTIYVLCNFKKVTTQQWIMFVGFAIGGIIICLSPASRNRVSDSHTPLLISILNLLHYALGLYVLFGAVIINIWRKRLTIGEIYKENSFFINAAICAMIVNFIISIGTSRQVYAISLFCIIVGLRLLTNQSLSKGWLIACGIVACGHLYIQTYNTVAMRQFTSDVNCQLRAADSLARRNDDAKIFINLYPRSNCLMSFLDDYTENNSFTKGSGNHRNLVNDIYNRYPSIKNITIMPRELRCLENTTADNGIMECGDGTYLMFATDSMTDITKAVAHRTIGIPNTFIKTNHGDVEYCIDPESPDYYKFGEYNTMLISQYNYIPIIQIKSLEQL
ncbi:MAG: DUF6056 family protein [Pseudoflavonifractor sp.]|nr:DUF6056 family protein [Pseudoflavonifractor sp.]